MDKVFSVLLVTAEVAGSPKQLETPYGSYKSFDLAAKQVRTARRSSAPAGTWKIRTPKGVTYKLVDGEWEVDNGV